VDGCDTAAFSVLPLAAAATVMESTGVAGGETAAAPGRHDVCLRFARPRLDPLWALDWVEIEEVTRAQHHCAVRRLSARPSTRCPMPCLPGACWVTVLRRPDSGIVTAPCDGEM